MPRNNTRLTFRPGTRQIWLGLEGDSGGQGGSSSSAAATGSGSDGGTSSSAAVEFSAPQQAKVQELIDGTYAKAAAKTEAKFKAEMEKLQAEIEKLKGGDGKDGDKGDKGGDKGDKTYTKEQVDQALAQAEERHEIKLKAEAEARKSAEEKATNLLVKDRQAAIISAAAKANAINPDEIVLLTGHQIAHDEEGNIIVLNDKGGARLGPKGDPLTVEEFIRDFIEKRPNHKKGSGTGGAGSDTGNRQSGDSSTPKTPRDKIKAGLKVLKG